LAANFGLFRFYLLSLNQCAYTSAELASDADGQCDPVVNDDRDEAAIDNHVHVRGARMAVLVACADAHALRMLQRVGCCMPSTHHSQRAVGVRTDSRARALVAADEDVEAERAGVGLPTAYMKCAMISSCWPRARDCISFHTVVT
jgi:hypothetical protein